MRGGEVFTRQKSLVRTQPRPPDGRAGQRLGAHASGDLAGHRPQADPAAACPRGADLGTLAASDNPAADRCLLRLLEQAQGPGGGGDRGFAGAAVTHRRRLLAGVTSSGPAGGPYLPTQLALRDGPLLERAVRALPIVPEVLVVNASGRDHPRRAGLALHLGAVLGVPTVGVTTRPLVAEGAWPPDVRGATAPLRLGGEVVGCRVRTRRGPSRWPCTPPGRPTPSMRSGWCWPRPVVLGPQSPCAAPARWPEPGGRATAERWNGCRCAVHVPPDLLGRSGPKLR
jgi:hypothetical protein